MCWNYTELFVDIRPEFASCLPGEHSDTYNMIEEDHKEQMQ